MTRTIVVRAYAKFNPVLAVGAKRDDGYHEVVNVMQTLNLYDELHITYDQAEQEAAGFHHAVHLETAPGIELPNGDTLVTDAVSLWRTACFFVSKRLWGTVEITLHKTIPVQAGLGGGSSDAAAALRGLNELAGGPLAPGPLENVAGRCGSDVPFFLSPTGSAVATGRGEKVTAIDPLPHREFVVAWPGVGASTAVVYGRFEPSGDALPSVQEAETMARAGEWRNDLAAAARAQVPELAHVLTALDDAGRQVHVAGSGSAVLVPVDGGDDAAKVEALLEPLGLPYVRRAETVTDR